MTEETAKTMNTLNVLLHKTDELCKNLSKSLSEGKVRADEKIKEHPLPYVMGALAGGAAVGYLIARKR